MVSGRDPWAMSRAYSSLGRMSSADQMKNYSPFQRATQGPAQSVPSTKGPSMPTFQTQAPTDPAVQPPQNQPVANSGFDPSKVGTHQNIFQYMGGGESPYIINQGEHVGGEGGSIQDRFVDTKDHGNLKDAISVGQRDFGGEDAIGHGPGYNIDYSKLPNQGMTKFGRVDQIYQVKDPGDVMDQRGIVWDDNYGWITSKANRKPRLGDKLGPAIASLAMGGLMGVGLPAGLVASGVKAGFGALPQIGQGNYAGAGLSLLGAGLGSAATAYGLPGYATQAIKPALNMAGQYIRGRG